MSSSEWEPQLSTLSVYQADQAFSTFIDNATEAMLVLAPDVSRDSPTPSNSSTEEVQATGHRRLQRSLVTKQNDFARFTFPEKRGPRTPTFGPIEGVPVGMHFYSYRDLFNSGTHLSIQCGIAGWEKDGGSQSIVMNGKSDNADLGHVFIYVGEGGRQGDVPKDIQNCNQEFTRGNGGLRMSYENGRPVRVIRGHKLKRSEFAPEMGYRYDGLYRITKIETVVGRFGFDILQFYFERIAGQEPPSWEWEADRTVRTYVQPDGAALVKNEVKAELVDEAYDDGGYGVGPSVPDDEAAGPSGLMPIPRPIKLEPGAEPPCQAPKVPPAPPLAAAVASLPPSQPLVAAPTMTNDGIPLPMPIKMEVRDEDDFLGASQSQPQPQAKRPCPEPQQPQNPLHSNGASTSTDLRTASLALSAPVPLPTPPQATFRVVPRPSVPSAPRPSTPSAHPAWPRVTVLPRGTSPATWRPSPVASLHTPAATWGAPRTAPAAWAQPRPPPVRWAVKAEPTYAGYPQHHGLAPPPQPGYPPPPQPPQQYLPRPLHPTQGGYYFNSGTYPQRPPF